MLYAPSGPVMLDELMTPEPVVILLPEDAATLRTQIMDVLTHLEKERARRRRMKAPLTFEVRAIERVIDALDLLDRNEVNPATGERTAVA